MRIALLFKQNDRVFKKNLLFFLAAYFVVLFNYPLIRASTTSLFLDFFGAKASPTAWLWAVLFLSLTIKVCSDLQARFSVQKVFFGMSLASVLLFIMGTFGPLLGLSKLSFIPYIWKEIYIVLQVHLLLAYANNFFDKDDFKLILGPVGAVGSVGGILGGLLTSYLSHHGGTIVVMSVGIFFVLLPAIFFYFTNSPEAIYQEKIKKISPLESLDDPQIRKYVLYIAATVALTQFIINIADFKFHLVFEKAITDSHARTHYLGQIYTLTNVLTFVFQFLFLPLVLPRVLQKKYHLFIPITYLVLFLSLIGSHGLLPYAGLYVYFKASDYSLFSAGKEILYQVLSPTQKYGAKYLTDMLVYRFSKALIAVVLIYLQTSLILNTLMSIFLALWIILVFKIFQLHDKNFID